MTLLNCAELTPKQYGERHSMGEAAVRSRCEQGLISAYRTEGGHWKIRDVPDNAVPRDEYEKVLKENAALKSRLEGIHKLAAI